MSTAMHVSLVSHDTPAAGWRSQSPLMFTAAGAQIRLPADPQQTLRVIQKAARQLDQIGVQRAQLRGEGWDFERQWAFSKGFTDTRSRNQIDWAQQADELQALRDISNWVRSLVNAGPVEIYPESLASRVVERLQSLAPAAVTSTIVKGDELLAAGWVGIHAVGRASKRPPLMLVVDYNPSGRADAPIHTALVGKGITFDSGGYSIKANEGMYYMKCDMGGAATLAGALAYAIVRGLQQRVQLVLCCAENLIDGSAFKLGDVLTYKNGTTVEIVNTDAEGRLVLADGLLYAAEAGAARVIDAATLTGAAQTAVGNEYNALFALNDRFAGQALHLAQQLHEPLWRLPLQPWHSEQCPSAFADTANSRPVKGGGAGGASNAAGFLLRFAPQQGQHWLHFDIAGAYHANANALWATGATALGLRTLAALLLHDDA